MRASPSVSLVSLVSAVLGVSACGAAGVDVTSWHSADVNAGARELHVVDGFGSREAVGAAQDAAFIAARDGGWFHTVDATNDTLVVDDGTATLLSDGAVRPMESGSVYLRLDVTEWSSDITSDEREGVDEDGNPVTVLVDVTHGRADITATLARGDGTVLLTGYDVLGIHDEDGDDTAHALARATDDAIRQILAHITPTSSEEFVAFDARDEHERPILDEASQIVDDHGDLTPAVAKEDAFIAAHEKLASPLYNRAVMLDASDDYDGAIAGYDDARAHHPDDTLASLIDDARAACVLRRDSARSLGL